MLLRFKFSNYRCYAQNVEFDMVAKSIKEHKESLIDNNGVNILPVAAVYGANASGKSSFFMAFQRMRSVIVDRFIAREHNSEMKPLAFNSPFMFDKNLVNSPSSYEVSVAIGINEYRYGFTCTKDTILEEHLYKKRFSKKKTIEKKVFLREGKKISSDKNNKKTQEEIDYCFSMATEKILLLSDIGLRGKEAEICSVFLWFLTSEVVMNYEQDSFFTSRVCERFVGEVLSRKESDEVTERWISFIKEIDPSISDIKTFTETDSEGNNVSVAKTIHYYNGEEFPVRLNVESDGTNKILFISLLLFITLANGGAIFVDELDSKMHPLVLRKIVQMFADRDVNTKGAQLIFSAHNIINLDSSDLRRDEIWFVEKDNHKSSLRSLINIDIDDKNVRSDMNYGKNYLLGRFVAVPFK